MGDLKKAATNVESFLLFYPEDAEMLANKAYYLSQEAVDPTWMEARPEAAQYIKRELYEKEMLDFIEKKFTFGVSMRVCMHVYTGISGFTQFSLFHFLGRSTLIRKQTPRLAGVARRASCSPTSRHLSRRQS